MYVYIYINKWKNIIIINHPKFVKSGLSKLIGTADAE